MNPCKMYYNYSTHKKNAYGKFMDDNLDAEDTSELVELLIGEIFRNFTHEQKKTLHEKINAMETF